MAVMQLEVNVDLHRVTDECFSLSRVHVRPVGKEERRRTFFYGQLVKKAKKRRAVRAERV